MGKLHIGSVVLVAMLSVGLSACNRTEPAKTPAPASQAPVQAPHVPAPVVTSPAPDPALPAGEQPAPASAMAGSAPAIPGPARGGATSRAKQPPVLRAVRAARQADVDRLVFEFDSAGLPAWDVAYIDPPVLDCGSGEPVKVAGSAFLQIRFTGAQAHSDSGKSTSGPRRRKLALGISRELVRTCAFEGEIMYVLGVVRPNRYTPRTMAAPSRLVIDIAH